MSLAARRGAALFAATLLAVPCFVQADSLDAPANYYAAATGTGATLKSQLYTVTSTGFVSRSYGDNRYSEGVTDRDPAKSSNILLVYNRASVSGAWDAGVTFNREHVWPKSLLGLTSAQVTNSYSGIASDLFELRPANPSVNSTRSNYGYGYYGSATPAAGYGLVNSGAGTFWYPGIADTGDVARTIFYMATRYGQGQANNISLVDGAPTTYQMGDKNSLLHWMYQDEVDTFERTRNQTIYSSALNPTYYQGNRNPYIDHPEYVWSIFGTGANTSQLFVGTPTASGTTTTDIDLGSVISGSAFGTQTLALSKTGTTPTTYEAITAGEATSTLSGVRKSFDYGTGTRSFTVGISGATTAVGARSGSVLFNNTDITAGAATGQGANDGDDTVSIHGRVVTHAHPSLSTTSMVTSATYDFGIVAKDSAALSSGFSVANQGAAGGFVAGLDVDSADLTGDTAAFSQSLGTSTSLQVGGTRDFAVSLQTATLGTYSATLNAAVSDENIPGSTALGSLSLSLTARVAIGGDATLDDSVNFDDLIIVAQNYNSPTATVWQTGDFTRDGSTNFDDLIVLAQNYNTSAAAVASLGSGFASDWALARALVPEPTTFTLVTSSLLILRRRRARA